MPHEQAPSGIDPTVPSIARTYDYMIGGKDNFASDREVGEKIYAELPGAVMIAVDNRKILGRAVRYMVETADIDQFIDFGSGLPTARNVHQVAQGINPDARVVYVDNDPAVLAHGRALLAENGNTTVIQADIRDPRTILDHPETRRLIDFSRPVGVIMCAILHHLLDEEDPQGIVDLLSGAVPTGSHLFITHFRTLGNAESHDIEAILQQAYGRGAWRTDADIADYFAGLDLVDPGVVPVAAWRPDTETDEDTDTNTEELTIWQRLIVGGLGYKP